MPTASLTATYDPALAVTRTSPPQATCPSPDASLTPDFKQLLDVPFPQVEQPILDYLNAGGTKQSVIHALTTPGLEHPEKRYHEVDVTGDAVSELIISSTWFYVFGCDKGAYRTLLAVAPGADLRPGSILTVKDINLDGVPEIALYYGDACFANSCGALSIFEWDGEKFNELLGNERGSQMDAAFVTEFRDTDNNGTFEIILHGKLPVWTVYRDGLPWRTRTDTYMWNGDNFIRAQMDFEAPQYRFQAIQDGDRFTLSGDYDQALAMYQLAIFSDKLEWWSPKRRENLQAAWDLQYAPNPVPTPTSPAPDSNEYYALAAYARYRIMLLHLLRGWTNEAEIVYETLQAKFPAGSPGHIYAEMAVGYWDEYQASGNMRQACMKAIDYARAYPELLTPLGSDYHGWQSKTYKPTDVCPIQ